MADNYVENHQLEFEAQKAKKEKERKKRMHRYLVAYRKKLEQQKQQKQQLPNNDKWPSFLAAMAHYAATISPHESKKFLKGYLARFLIFQ